MHSINNPEDLKSLRQAVALLEGESLTIQLASLIGKPIEWAMDKLPKGAAEKIALAVEVALNKSVDAALWSMSGTEPEAAWNKTHVGLAAVSGAVGGFFGMTGTLMELPVSTTLMMRSVADIARSQGFDLSDPLIKAECIQVFAMGGPDASDDGAESAYYGMRNAMVVLAQEVGRSMAEVAAKQAAAAAAAATATAAANAGNAVVEKEVASVLVRLIESVAARFSIQVTEKMAAQAVPVVGAITGATINTMFMNHFQDMAQGHFTVLRLEKIYGKETVQLQYESVQKLLKKG